MKPQAGPVLEDLADLGLNPADVIFVGDSDVDMHTARNGGMTACGVLWGFRSRKELEEAGAERLIAHPSELLDYFN